MTTMDEFCKIYDALSVKTLKKENGITVKESRWDKPKMITLRIIIFAVPFIFLLFLYCRLRFYSGSFILPLSTLALIYWLFFPYFKANDILITDSKRSSSSYSYQDYKRTRIVEWLKKEGYVTCEQRNDIKRIISLANLYKEKAIYHKEKINYVLLTVLASVAIALVQILISGVLSIDSINHTTEIIVISLSLIILIALLMMANQSNITFYRRKSDYYQELYFCLSDIAHQREMGKIK